MTNRNYRRGYEIERKIVNEFRTQGYWAYRSAGSHSKVDVTVIKPNGEILLLQVKRMKQPGAKYDSEIKEMTDYQINAPNVSKQLWIYKDYEKKANRWQKIIIP